MGLWKSAWNASKLEWQIQSGVERLSRHQSFEKGGRGVHGQDQEQSGFPMKTIYTVADNSHHVESVPWIASIISGVEEEECQICGRGLDLLENNNSIVAELKDVKSSLWPDVIGCGAIPGLMVLSERCLSASNQLGYHELPGGPMIFTGISKKRSASTPRYSWINGRQLQMARMNFTASGFVDASPCPGCHFLDYNVSKTYDIRHSPGNKYVLEDIAVNAVIFTTDLTPFQYFCTGDFVELAKAHRLTNFRFVPLEWGTAYSGPGMKYLD